MLTLWSSDVDLMGNVYNPCTTSMLRYTGKHFQLGCSVSKLRALLPGLAAEL